MSLSQTSTAAAVDTRLGAIVSGIAVLAAGAAVLPFVATGPLSGHMAVHIATMNVAAPPLAAAALTWRGVIPHSCPAPVLWIATITQLIALWGSHSPALHEAAMLRPALLAGAHLGLFISAFAFWACIVHPACSRWQAMLALLISGKLACLLGVLLIFAPRPLFTASAAMHLHHAPGIGAISPLADQHLAGLLMIAACPLSYVLAALVVASQTLSGLEQRMQSPLARGRARVPA